MAQLVSKFRAGEQAGVEIYDLRQAFNVMTLSVTEGEDKPLEYPVLF